MVLAVGIEAPDFAAPDATGRTWRLADLVGRAFVLSFYPKDETAGCIRQVCAFRDVWTDLQEAGVTVFGVSRDDAEAHRAFAANRQLPYTLLTDESGEMHKRYDVGRTFGVTNRVSYLVGPDGHIVQAYKGNLSPQAHAQRMLKAAQQARAGSLSRP